MTRICQEDRAGTEQGNISEIQSEISKTDSFQKVKDRGKAIPVTGRGGP
jgi:hypothetical protein